MNEIGAKNVQIVKIDDGHSGQRLDNFLLRHLKGVPRTFIYRIIRKGQVRVNNKRSRAHTRLESGDEIRIPPVRIAQRDRQAPPQRIRDRLLSAIIFEDEHLIILDKPAGIPVHGGSGNEYGVIESMRAAKPNTPFIELAHRLDKETSGCLVLARSRNALVQLHRMFRAHDGGVEKVYTALLKGRWEQGVLDVDVALSRNSRGGAAGSSRPDEAGKEALTRFSPTSLFSSASLVKAIIATGRMHQIRAHAAWLGHPVAGDEKYGDFSFNHDMKRRYGLNRMFLHASRIQFRHPHDNRKLSFHTPLPDTLKPVLSRLADEPL